MKLEKLTDKEYRGLNAESYSSIKHLLKSPEIFKYYKTTPFKASAAMDLGTTVHHFLQKNEHLVLFKPNDRTKEGKESFRLLEDSFFQQQKDGIVVSDTIKDKVDTILKNSFDNPKICELLAQCDYEVGFIKEINGMTLKGKLDGYHKDFILDIKTTSMGATQKEFKQTIDNFNYDLQAALYLQLSGSTHDNYYFIVCNTVKPFEVKLYKASKEVLSEGNRKLNVAIENYKRYIINGEVWSEPIEEI